MTEKKKWWKSKTVRAWIVWGLVALMQFIATVTWNPDLVISPEFQTEILTAIMSIVGSITAVLVVIGRFKAKSEIK